MKNTKKYERRTPMLWLARRIVFSHECSLPAKKKKNSYLVTDAKKCSCHANIFSHWKARRSMSFVPTRCSLYIKLDFHTNAGPQHRIGNIVERIVPCIPFPPMDSSVIYACINYKSHEDVPQKWFPDMFADISTKMLLRMYPHTSLSTRVTFPAHPPTAPH